MIRKNKMKYYLLFIIPLMLIILPGLLFISIRLLNNNPTFGIVEINEPIMSSREIVAELNELEKDDRVDGIILRINTPGGAVAPSQEIYEKVKLISENNVKPIIASMESIATSGGYYIAIGADTIIANKGTLTGSIGVIMNYPIFINLLDNYGVDYKTIKSGTYKDSGSSFRHSTIQDSLYFQNVVDNMYSQFIDVLKYERGFSNTFIASVANGQVYTGSQAQDLNLIDMIGTFEDSIDLLLLLTGNVGKKADIIDVKKDESTLIDVLFKQMSEIMPINKMLLFPLPEFKLDYNSY